MFLRINKDTVVNTNLIFEFFKEYSEEDKLYYLYIVGPCERAIALGYETKEECEKAYYSIYSRIDINEN